MAQQSGFAGISHVCAQKMLHHLKLTVEKFPRMQFEHNLQLQAQLESGIVDCMRSTHFSFHAILFLIFFVACSPEGFDILCQKWVAEASRFDNQYVRCWCLNC